MVGLIGLQQAAPRLAATTGAAGDLLQELKRPLPGAQITAREANIGIDHANQRHQREIMPFCNKLGADDEIEIPPCDGFEFGSQALGAAGKIGGKHEGPGLRKQFRRLFRQPFHPRPASGDAVHRRAFRANIGTPLDMATMVTHQRLAKAVLHQPRRAIGTLEAVTAAFAQGQRGIAAPVEKQQRLLAARDGFRDFAHETGRQPFPFGGSSRA